MHIVARHPVMRPEVVYPNGSLDVLECWLGFANVMRCPAIVTFRKIRAVFGDHGVVRFLSGFNVLCWKGFVAEARLAFLIVIGRPFRLDSLVQNITLRQVFAVSGDK